MLIQYVGKAGRRIVGELEWNKENGFETEVEDPQTVSELLSHPPGDFQIADGETLLAIADKEEQTALAAELGSTLNELRGWIKSAAKLAKVEV